VSDYKQIDRARTTLRLGESATILEIKKAFRKLSIKYHPDKLRAIEKPQEGYGKGGFVVISAVKKEQ